MALTTIITAGNILNRVAAEVGLQPIADPYSTQDPAFIQMQFLLNTAGEELLFMYEWEFLIREHQFTTNTATDTGAYDLPDDFAYQINQTGWERSQNVPLGGPLSAQDWTYLKGRDLVNNTLYASFRIFDGKFNLYPDPVPDNLDVNYEYITKNWVSNGQSPATFQDEILLTSDLPMYDKTLITRYVKLKYLEAAGFDTTKAQNDFNQAFAFITGKDVGAPVLNAGRTTRQYPYLSVFNLPDTGYGF